jgi:hypothetical protein
MRSAERELIEIERKRQAAENIQGGAGRTISTVDIGKEKIAELTKQITEESKKLANARIQIAKIKSGGVKKNLDNIFREYNLRSCTFVGFLLWKSQSFH